MNNKGMLSLQLAFTYSMIGNNSFFTVFFFFFFFFFWRLGLAFLHSMDHLASLLYF